MLLAGFALAAGMALMGIWQLRVYQNQGAEAAARRAAEPAVPLSAVAPVGGAVGDGYGRTVTFAGTYDPAHQKLLTVDGVTDRFRVVTLLRTDDGAGSGRGTWCGHRDGVDATGRPPGTGRPAAALRGAGTAGPGTDPVRVSQLAQTWPGPLVDGFVTLSAGEAERQGLEPAKVGLPEGRGRLRNGAYAMQWWLFAGFAVVMAVRIARDLHPESVDHDVP